MSTGAIGVGSVVKLKSGGPEMTVLKIDKLGATPGVPEMAQAECGWFSESERQDMRRGFVPLAALELIESGDE